MASIWRILGYIAILTSAIALLTLIFGSKGKRRQDDDL